MPENDPPATVKLQKYQPFEYDNNAKSFKEIQMEPDNVSTAGIVEEDEKGTGGKLSPKFLCAIKDRCKLTKLRFFRMGFALGLIGVIVWNISIQISLKKVGQLNLFFVFTNLCFYKLL